MKQFPGVPRRAMFLIVSLLLVVLGSMAVQSRPVVETRALEHPSAPPPTIADTIVPPHREPPPPPPPPTPPAPPPPKPATPAAALRASIRGAFSGSTATAKGIYVEVDGLGTVLDVDGSALVVPASLTKLFTGGSAMLRLGNETRFRTEVASYGAIGPDGTLNGPLAVVGGGDPSLSRIELQSLVARIYDAGVRHVAGDLFVDDSRFDRVRDAPGWRSFYFPDDVGTLSAFAVDGNIWRTDPGFYADPAMGNLELFRTLLGESGITVAGSNKLGRPEGTPNATLAMHDSAPLGVLLGDVMKKSENFYAEMILKQLGQSSGTHTTAGGVGVIGSVAQELGVARGSFFDGSGLSIDNRESPIHVVEWLKAMDLSPVRDSFRESLARPCTGAKYLLEKRMCGTPAVGKVNAKTGTLLKTRAVAGYATTASGRKVWFAFMLTGVQSTQRAWEAFDRALVAITSFPR